MRSGSSKAAIYTVPLLQQDFLPLQNLPILAITRNRRALFAKEQALFHFNIGHHSVEYLKFRLVQHCPSTATSCPHRMSVGHFGADFFPVSTKVRLRPTVRLSIKTRLITQHSTLLSHSSPESSHGQSPWQEEFCALRLSPAMWFLKINLWRKFKLHLSLAVNNSTI